MKNQFLLTSENQIRKIIETGIAEVHVDLGKSFSIIENLVPEEKTTANLPSANIVPLAFEDIISDKQLPPPLKAERIRQCLEEMMSNLMSNPTADNISATKKVINTVVELILVDPSTSHHLMMLTRYDYSTYAHSVRVGIMAICFAKNLLAKSNAHDLHKLGAGFFLHDLGKVLIDQEIINKPTKLTTKEMAEMKQHPLYGFKILCDTKQIDNEAKIIVLHHHERKDGSGYPYGIKGSDVHIYGKICALADVYDALTMDRPYRKKMKPYDGLKLMKDQMTHYFEKDLFEAFVLMLANSEHTSNA